MASRHPRRYCSLSCKNQWHYHHSTRAKRAMRAEEARRRERETTTKENNRMTVIESKEAANYTDHGSAQEHCAICDHWRATGTGEAGLCRIVSGRIAATGWCRHFTHVPEAA